MAHGEFITSSASPVIREIRGRAPIRILTQHYLTMSIEQIARNLRQNQTKEEKELWLALRGSRFAGFKFRRQPTLGEHILDFYCADAKLAVELDGFQHGRPDVVRKDRTREKFLEEQGVEILRFWNHQWLKNREGCLLEIWNAVQRRTGCIQTMKNTKDHRFVSPEPHEIDTSLSMKHADS